MTRDLNTVLKKLHIGNDRAGALAPHWDESIQTLPEGPLPFLQPEAIAAYRQFCSLDSQLDAPLQEVARRIESSPELRLLIWHCYRSVYVYSDVVQLRQWPTCFNLLGDHGGLFYLLVAQAMVPMVREVHAKLRVDLSVTRDTCRQVAGFNEYHKVGCDGRPGILTTQIHWLEHHVAGRIFRLRRFEFMLKPLPTPLRVYEQRDTGKIILFMPPERHLNREGFVVPADFPAAAWTSRFQETKQSETGCPVSPWGMALNRDVTLSKAKWRQILGPNDYVLDMHIPPGGGMTPQVCAVSMSRAFEFFCETLGQDKAKAIYCGSWIFNTQLEERLPDSNLAKFMREIYLFPIPSSGRDGLDFVFCREYEDWSQAPQKTRLERSMIDIYTRGAGLRCGGMIFMRKHLPHFGQQYYRKHWSDGGERR